MSNTRNPNEIQKPDKGPVLKVLVKGTNPSEGICGHVSAVSKHGKEKTVTSFEPSTLGMLNIFSIPVPGANATDPKEDKKQADYIFKKQLSPEEYRRVVNHQKELEKKIEKKEVLYSFMGENGFSRFMASFLHHSPSIARKSTMAHRKNLGFDPTVGDHFAEVSVAEDDHHNIPEPKLENCVSTVYSVVDTLFGGNSKIPKPNALTTPTEFAQMLEKTGEFKVKTRSNKS